MGEKLSGTTLWKHLAFSEHFINFASASRPLL
jgi:hypothetical protein